MDIQTVRQQFPVFSENKLEKIVFLDGAAGTQMCASSIRASNEASIDHNSNLGGRFSTSLMAETQIARARTSVAAFFNSHYPEEIIFGQNMTTLTYHLSRCIGRTLQAGDEIVLTQSDHEANISPWLELAEDRNLVVRWLPFDFATYGYDSKEANSIINARTRLVALNYANNVTGTINNITTVSKLAKIAGAIVYVDAVHFAPHCILDVQTLGCDFVACSSHKFYGPHQGILWGRLELLDAIHPYKLRPTSPNAPYKFETGTKNREAIAGVLGAIEHLKWIGKTFHGCPRQASEREQIVAGMMSVIAHEQRLLQKTIKGLQAIPAINIHGHKDLSSTASSAPTVSFTLPATSSESIALQLAEKGIFVWHGNNFSPETVKHLVLDEQDGVVRVSISQYTSEDDIDRFLEAMCNLEQDACPTGLRVGA